ncbi:MAG: T9SS type A sorting domain-containing protein [Flavobacterium sp.]|nr:T9SS type A sorting domain-containing protein [Flavobacterium sp.]
MKKQLLLFCFILLSSIVCGQQLNQPADLYRCGNGQTTVCFDLTQNDVLLLEGLNPSQYQISYHHTTADAQTGSNPILTATQYCTTFSEQIYTRLVNLQDNIVTVASFGIYLVDTPPAPTQNLTVCANVTAGPICVNLESIVPNMSSGGAFTVTFYETQADASAGTNAIQNTTCYTILNALPSTVLLYYRLDNTSSSCTATGIVNVYIVQCNPTCQPPSNFIVNLQVDNTTVNCSWAQNTFSSQTDVFYQPFGGPSPNLNTVPTASTFSSNCAFTGLLCGTGYEFYVRGVCNQNDVSNWAGPYILSMQPCQGQPTNLAQCSDNGSACFNLNDNDAPILGPLNPSEYGITYHISQSDATTGVNPINTAQPFCTTSSPVLIFARLLNIANNETQVFTFQLLTQTTSTGINQLANMVQCDDNNDGLVTFDLTTVQSQINDLGSLTFYVNYQDAVAEINAISNPTSYTLSAAGNSMPLVVRVTMPGCDTLYNLLLVATPNCNVSSTCINANSLCSALGAPFSNTQFLVIDEPGANYGCLNSHPNPTWFYLPVSSSGTINLKIEQNRSISFDSDFLDVDYIVYGPFTSPTAPCNDSLTANNIVSCSYSANAIEYPIISNAQAGQYYLIMTTNYSNQSGYIRITETTNSQGGINCSGIRLNAFLDSNANGIKDNGEQNFPLGQFQIEKNNDGNIHHVTAASGVYSIYDENAASSYDLGYAIDPAYSATYALTTSSYSNISPIIGGGMQLYSFPVTILQSYQDLAVSIIPLQQPRAGFIYSNKIVYANYGNQTIAAGTLTFIKDDTLTITANSQAGTATSSNGFSYNFTNLQPFEVRTMIVSMQVPPIPVVNLGQLLTNSASIMPLDGDVVPENNSSTLSEIVIGSYDPNDKTESHGDKILTSSFGATDYLYYTIRFENTGTASAINVRINDVLDSKLDETSIKMVSASHDYVLDRVDSNLSWRFDNIQLPPSVADQNIGKGYVTFKVKPKSGYSTGDIIPNTAGIFFDFNPVIVTNTFLTEFVALLEVDEFEISNFVFYPNPVHDELNVSVKNSNNTIDQINVYDVLGKTMLHKKATATLQTESINVSQLAKGIYFVEITTNNQSKVIKKIVVE